MYKGIKKWTMVFELEKKIQIKIICRLWRFFNLISDNIDFCIYIIEKFFIATSLLYEIREIK